MKTDAERMPANMEQNNDMTEGTRSLLKTLMREYFQTETSAALHCRREAERLGDTPPAYALRAVAAHADEVLATLPALAKRHDLPVSAFGSATGALFSQLRDKLGDMLIDSERSYRGTMLGCRHGIDLVKLMAHATAETKDLELAEFLQTWLSTRIVLMQNLEDELAWFAKNPDQARKTARPPLLSRRRASLQSSQH